MKAEAVTDAGWCDAGSLHRFFVDPGQMEGSRVWLSPQQSHQAARVLRLRPGERVCILDGSGLEYLATLERVQTDGCLASITAQRLCPAEPRTHVCLGLGVLKGERMDWAIQKATEAGVGEVVPLDCARSVVRLEPDRASARVRRWQAIAQEAAEQCRRGRVPPIGAPAPLSAVLSRAVSYDLALLAFEGEAAPLADVVQAGRPPEAGAVQRVLLLIGPEGGFALEEVAAARVAGAIPVSLGPRILRAETAAAIATALVLHLLGD